MATQPQLAAGAADAYRRAREHLAGDDIDGATQWLERAADGNHPAALTELAIVHLHGFGRDADPARALTLLERAAAVGGTPETSWLLAQIVLGGVLIPCDPVRVDTLLADAARRGFPAALRVAGLCFGRDPDPAMQQAASECFRRACELRDPVGAALYADRLHAGIGIARDERAAGELAAQLRAMGIPVELPAAAASTPATSTAGEPPWHRLRHRDDRPRSRVDWCAEPEIATWDDCLGDEECRYIIYSGARFLERSQVIHPHTGQPLEKGLRISQDMAFVPTHDDVGIRLLQRRLARLAGFDLAPCEPLTLLRYRPGEEYRPHRDYFTPSAPQLAQPGGQRHSTVCLYLNDVERGGETVFPECRVSVQPRRGRAVMFRNLHPDARPDPRSLHAGLPVLVGEKWLATCWIRSQPLRAF
ncbi:MAG: 2OG-Fe(II) oxygenase [Proteobacteria bacterium]|nr:2OG-Fe(II) oxygenase [Pseudomonadota bacterium]